MPDKLQVRFSDVLDECELPADLVGFDCGEPPCIGAMRISDPTALRSPASRCQLWRKRLGPGTSLKHVRASCGDGRIENIAFFHIAWGELNRAHGGNLQTRIERRRKRIESAWECLPP
jgi:hypothetical protein